MARPTYAQIDLDAVIRNIHAIKDHIGQRKICAAVKADAYGHGAVAVAHAMSAAGADMFAVAMTEEAVQLREAGIQKPIILLTVVPEDDIETILEFDICACIAEEAFAVKLSEIAQQRGTTARAHVNVDTGMGRVGLEHASAAYEMLKISRLPALEIEGVFTHLACSEDNDVSSEQLDIFQEILLRLESSGMKLPAAHVSNSTATLQMPEAYLQCVRPGLILYGLHPPGVRCSDIDLVPALSLHTSISFCKRVTAGTKLGYGHTFTTSRESIIATLPLGYHDGYVRQFSNNGEVLVKGRRAPVVGRVCMDQTLVDVTDVPGVQVGDDVVVYGRQGDACISLEEMAQRLDRIPYELTCAVGARVRRRYVLNGKLVGETPVGSLIPPDVLCNIFSGSQIHVPTHENISKRGAA